MSVLYGIGLGPGDPELMTLKADRLIRAAAVLAYPAPDTGESFARRIAAGAIRADAVEIPIVIPMRAKRFPAQAVYDAAAAEIGGHLDGGRDVVVLCEGDPFFYGSFMYLHQRLSTAHRVEIVPGVTSMTAVAGVAGRPLCARNEVLSVIPAPLGEAEIAARLEGSGAAVIMKVGRHLPKVRRVVEAAGLMRRAVYVSHASLPEERHVPLADAPDDAPYFSMILIPGEDPYAA
ncbi:precorrin-2 C(20)-methyltransferase [Algicella marina]|nr:precorrin-2 C(20)-methyltransferase [Algicella marina]